MLGRSKSTKSAGEPARPTLQILKEIEEQTDQEISKENAKLVSARPSDYIIRPEVWPPKTKIIAEEDDGLRAPLASLYSICIEAVLRLPPGDLASVSLPETCVEELLARLRAQNRIRSLGFVLSTPMRVTN